MAKQRNLNIKESFGEDIDGSYFKILLDDVVLIEEKGKLIKTLRKKAYKKLFDFVLDFEEVNNDTNIYDGLHDLKMM